MDDKTLRPGDARKIFEELLPAQNKSHMLGLALKLPLPIVEAIHSQYQNPRHRLFHVIIKFLEQAEPRPTWRDIVETLNSRAVNLPDLARRVEAAHCPDSITTSSSPQGPRRLIPASVAAHGSHWQPIHTAPGMDKTLRPADAEEIFEELLPAQNKSLELGLALNMPPPEVEAIHSQYKDPHDRLLRVIIKFLEQMGPRPTWRVIVEALRSCAVGLPGIARRVEAAHCPDSITISSSRPGPRRLIPASVAAHGSHWQPIHTAPGMDKTLRPDDAEEIFEELLPAQNKSLELGLVLNMPPPEVEAIHSQYKDPHDRLLRVIIKFLEQMGPRPTWRVIVEALRSCAVGLPGIARRVEAAHCPDSITISSSRPGPRRLIPASVAAHGSHWQPIHTAPGMDKTLRPDDAVKILEELLPAQNKSHMLGLALKLPLPIVETIHSHYQNPQDRLLHVIIAFLEQMGPRSTWRVIVEALRSRAVGLQGIARRVEAAHCPDSITISSSPPGPRCLIPVSLSSQLTLLSSSREVEEMILMLNKRFHRLKNTVRDGLVEHKVHVKRVVDALTSFPAEDDDYRMVFLQNHIGDLFKVADNFDLFTTMNFHWKYFDPSLLETITKEFEEVVEVKAQMEAYKSDLRQFRMKTPLTLFCHTQKRKRINISLEFQQMVAEFEWPETVTLEDVEQFRQQYAYEYNLQQCTLMVAKFLDLESSKPQDLHSPSNFPCTSSVVTLQKDEKKVSKKSKILSEETSAETTAFTKHSSADNILFVEQPAEDFFCPVTTDFLLQPHLTSCCGKHLSEEAVLKTNKACPLCNDPKWKTVLDKRFQRQVNSLRVFCRHGDRGCGWQGELAALDRHIMSCSMKDAPQVEEQPTLHANKDNKIIVAGVSIFMRQYFWYTGKQMDFIWEEAGISLHFPAARCMRSIQISVGIFTDLEQNCMIPQRYQLMPRASSTYEIKSSAPLPAPVRVRIEHCGIVEKENSLVHMVAHGDAPYQFKPLHGGHFPLNKSYGEIEMAEFCLLTILYNILDTKMMLAVFVAHLKENNTIHFLVTKNTPANHTAVQNKYTNASLQPPHTKRYFYGTTEISLSIPELSPDCDGWIIKPSCKPPVIDMLAIHTYEPGSVIPKIELKLKWQGTGEPKEQEVEIGVQGVRMESFTLSCKPQNPEQSAPVLPQPQNQSSPQQHSASTSPLQQPTDRPTLQLLLSFPTKSGSPINIIERIGTAYRKLGIILLNDKHGSLIDTIEAAHRYDLNRITETILQKWLEKKPRSWSELIAALRKIELCTLAYDLEGNLIH